MNSDAHKFCCCCIPVVWITGYPQVRQTYIHLLVDVRRNLFDQFVKIFVFSNRTRCFEPVRISGVNMCYVSSLV
jgi:hypothetical protein